jgi:hypothetical protein
VVNQSIYSMGLGDVSYINSSVTLPHETASYSFRKLVILCLNKFVNFIQLMSEQYQVVPPLVYIILYVCVCVYVCECVSVCVVCVCVRACGVMDIPASEDILYIPVSNVKVKLKICAGTAYF